MKKRYLIASAFLLAAMITYKPAFSQEGDINQFNNREMTSLDILVELYLRRCLVEGEDYTKTLISGSGFKDGRYLVEIIEPEIAETVPEVQVDPAVEIREMTENEIWYELVYERSLVEGEDYTKTLSPDWERQYKMKIRESCENRWQAKGFYAGRIFDKPDWAEEIYIVKINKREMSGFAKSIMKAIFFSAL